MLIMATPNFCTGLSPIWQIVGWVLLVFKVAIPLIIIIFGMIDLGKAVVASKDEEIKKSVKSLAMRAIAGVVIFFIPNLIGLVFSLVSEFQNNDDYVREYEACRACIVDPGGNECTGYVNSADDYASTTDSTDSADSSGT